MERGRRYPLVITLEKQCSTEMCRFFATYSRLKEYLGESHFVMANDIINRQEWICLRINELDTEIQVSSRKETAREHVQI